MEKNKHQEFLFRLFSPNKIMINFFGGEFLEEKKGKMTVEEAGRRGGLKTSETHGEEFYSEIGRKGGRIGGPKGGQRVRKIIQEDKAYEEE
jgi:general stress protein YciG